MYVFANAKFFFDIYSRVFLKTLCEIQRNSHFYKVFTVAERGAVYIKASSPKHSPFPSSLIYFS